MDSSLVKLCLATFVRCVVKSLPNVSNEVNVWVFPPTCPVSHDCIGWQGLDDALTQPCQCSMFCSCPARERRWPLLRLASPKRSDIAVWCQPARADVCLQSINDVVMTVQLVGLDLLGLWISAKVTPMNESTPSPDVFLLRTWECGSQVLQLTTFLLTDGCARFLVKRLVWQLSPLLCFWVPSAAAS